MTGTKKAEYKPSHYLQMARAKLSSMEIGRLVCCDDFTFPGKSGPRIIRMFLVSLVAQGYVEYSHSGGKGKRFYRIVRDVPLRVAPLRFEPLLEALRYRAIEAPLHLGRIHRLGGA